MNDRNPWRIRKWFVKGIQHWLVYKLRNEYEVDHVGNRVYPDTPNKGLFRSKTLAQEECDRLNGLLKEDKIISIRKLFECMKTFQNLEDLEDLKYVIEDMQKELVVATYKSGRQTKIYVTGCNCHDIVLEVLRYTRV